MLGAGEESEASVAPCPRTDAARDRRRWERKRCSDRAQSGFVKSNLLVAVYIVKLLIEFYIVQLFVRGRWRHRRSRDLIPRTILGVRVRVEEHVARGTRGLRVSCPNAGHPSCNKYRAIGVIDSERTVQSAVSYLETWLSMAMHMGHAEHARWKPRKEEIDAYISIET